MGERIVCEDCIEKIISRVKHDWTKPVDQDNIHVSSYDPYRVKLNHDDPEHPYMWSLKKKALYFVIVFFMTFIIFSSLTFYVPHLLVKPELHRMLIGLAFGPLIGAPLSKYYGHKRLFLVFAFVFMAINLCLVASSYRTLTTIMLRFLSGLLGGIVFSSCRLSIFDIFNETKTSFPGILLHTSIMLGLHTGPILGLLIEKYKNTMWSFWIVFILSSSIFILGVIVLEEASPEIILNKRISRLRWITGSSRFIAYILTKDYVALFIIISKIVLFSTSFLAHPFSLMQTYKLDVPETYISLLFHTFGALLAILYYKVQSRLLVEQLKSLFWMAFTTKENFHRLVPFLSHAVLGFSETLVLDGLEQYIEISYSEEPQAANINLSFPLLVIAAILHGFIKISLKGLFSTGVLSGGIITFSSIYFLNKQFVKEAANTVESESKTPNHSSKNPVNPPGLYQYCNPRPISDRLIRKGYISYYDRRLRVPAWVLIHITPTSLKTIRGNRKYSNFKEDPYIPEKFRAKLSDYFHSGYDRGHLAPAANTKFSQEALDETFYLTNIVPQVGEGFNRNYWERFESFCRDLTSNYTSVYLVIGPLYLPKKDSDGKWRVSYEMIGNPPNVAVPTHFFAVIYAEDDSRKDSVTIGSFVFPNAKIDDNTKLTDFIVPINAIERASGLDFEYKSTKKQKELCKEVKCVMKKYIFKKYDIEDIQNLIKD
ncbi:hypothetical protein PMAC_000190 [Pneumocystis sp. 'macacae']|nr:hypothetical protein PMAC_000190 [Pneumocystis sp. 'macacae']